MAKKANQITKYLLAVAAVLGIVAVVMIFLPSLVAKEDTTEVYNGLKLVFGYSETRQIGSSTITTTYFEFSIMGLLTYLLAIAGIVFAVLGTLGKGSKFAALIAAAAFIVAGIFFFLQVSFLNVTDDVAKAWETFGYVAADVFKLGAGAIIGGICSILAGVACVGKVVIK